MRVRTIFPAINTGNRLSEAFAIAKNALPVPQNLALSGSQIVILGITLLITLIHWMRVVDAHQATSIGQDFPYFWTAGSMWLEWRSAYSPEYLETGRTFFSTFSNPFFYPPALLPLLAPLGMASPHQAAAGLAILSIICLYIILAISAHLANQFEHGTRQPYCLIGIALYASLYMRPVIRVVEYGQITLIIACAITVLLAAIHFRKPVLTTLGLTVAMVKPQFGAPLLAFCLMRKETRIPAVASILCIGTLSLLGLAQGDLFANLKVFFANVHIYSTLSENRQNVSGGMNLLFHWLNIDPPLFIRLCLAVFPASLLAWAMRANTSREFFIAGAFAVIVWGFIVLPSHSTDYVLLLPGLALLTLKGPIHIKAMFLSSFLLLGRSWNLASIITPAGQDSDIAASIIHTAGPLLLLISVLTLVFSASTVQSNNQARPHPAPIS